MSLKKSVLLFFLLCFNTTTYSGSKSAIAVASVGISIAGIYTFYRWWRKPEKFNPSVDNLNTLTVRHTKELDPNTLNLNIDQLVERIHNNKTPQQAHVIINRKS